MNYMQNRKIIYGFLFLLFSILLILGIVINFSKNQDLKVVFFDVGQGDAILISQGSNQLLIDGGKSGQVLLEKLGKYVPFWDRKIEAVLMTHPDQDHIGGFVDVFKNYEVKTVIKTQAKNSSQTFEAIGRFIDSEGSEVIEAKNGSRIVFSEEVELEIIYPFDAVSENLKDTNGASIVSLLKKNDFNFLFMGDLPAEKEEEILEKGVGVKADVLKVGHHGSKYSTGEKFLEKVSPQEAILSVGKFNSYGHPAPEVLEKLKKANVNILRTDEDGDIVYECKKTESYCNLIAR